MPESCKPDVSIILPTYNRAQFLRDAFAAIRNQQWTDWELIVVDDGSTDNTRELVTELTRGWEQPVRYLYQENQGAYGARNTGLDLATGKYVAFYDSDDLWLLHHLGDCVAALEMNDGVDITYGACRMVDNASGRLIAESTFYVDGEPRPFLGLKIRKEGDLRIIDDSTAFREMLNGRGIYCGLQNSVIRRSLFDAYRFNASLRNEAEDQLFVLLALACGRKFGFFDRIHVIYQVHASNSSGAATAMSIQKKCDLHTAVIKGFQQLPGRLRTMAGISLNFYERLALNRRLSKECFWHLGYSVLWKHGQTKAAIVMFVRGIALYPLSLSYWKTLLVSLFRVTTGTAPRPT